MRLGPKVYIAWCWGWFGAAVNGALSTNNPGNRVIFLVCAIIHLTCGIIGMILDEVELRH